MAVVVERKLTLEEFLTLPETKPASELIDGEVVQKSMPAWAHSIIERLLGFVFTVYLRDHPIGDAGPELRRIFGPPGGERPYVPDFVFVTADRIPSLTGHFWGAPDLAVEILSPDDRMSRVMEKLQFYLTNGVRLVWLIDPDTRTVTVMSTPHEARILSEQDTVDGGDVLPGFTCAVRDILPPTQEGRQPAAGNRNEGS